MGMATDATIERRRPQDGPQRAFSKCQADVCIYGGGGGGGKTWGLTAEPLYHVRNPKFSALILRRTFPEIFMPGGPWSEAETMYEDSGAQPILSSPRGPAFVFPGGSFVKFDHLHHEKDRKRYQGGQIPLICFDLLEHFTASQWWYLFSRNRSTCGVRPYIRATCNPEPGWLADLMEWWIDQTTGYAIPDRSGVIRYMSRVGDDVKWGDTEAEMIARYPHTKPRSFTFIHASLYDNKILMAADPGYEANLMALPYVEQERLLRGNWIIRDTDGAEWPADYWADIWAEEWPHSFEATAIAVDASKGVEQGDPSAIVFLGLASGTLWVDADICIRPAEEIVSDGIDRALLDWPDAFGIESNSFQELFGILFERECADRGIVPLPMHMIHNHVKKQVRIRRLGPYLKAGKLKIRRNPGGRVLLEQLSGFPIASVHDDGPDATEMALRLLTHVVQGSREMPESTLLVG